MHNGLANHPLTDPAQILRYRERQYAAELLATLLLHFDFFSWIQSRKSVSTQEIQSHFGFAARPLDVALTLCRANQFIVSHGGNHQLTQLAREHLVSDSPWYLGPYYTPIKEDTPIVHSFLKVLKSGKPANWQAQDGGQDWHESMLTEEFARGFTSLMNCRGLALGQALARSLSPWIGGRISLLDVGGGSGIYAATLVAAYPQLKAHILEQPPVDAIASSEILRHGLNQNIQVLSANMFKDAWPENLDIVLLSNVLHDWDVPEVEMLIVKASRSLKSNGLLVIHEAFINNDKSGPLAVAEYSALLMNITQGKCYTPEEYAHFLEPLNFQVHPLQPTIADRGFISAIKI